MEYLSPAPKHRQTPSRSMRGSASMGDLHSAKMFGSSRSSTTGLIANSKNLLSTKLFDYQSGSIHGSQPRASSPLNCMHNHPLVLFYKEACYAHYVVPNNVVANSLKKQYLQVNFDRLSTDDFEPLHDVFT